MAVAPFYLASMAALQSELRLTDVPSTDDAFKILERATVAARGDIFAKLGATTANSWAAIGDTENPTSEQGVLRNMASTLEVKLVFLRLLDTLPNFFMDDSGGDQEAYNKEGLFRSRSAEEREELRAACNAEVDQLVELLLGNETLGDTTGRGSVYTDDTSRNDKPKMGDTALYLPDDKLFDGNFKVTGLFPED